MIESPVKKNVTLDSHSIKMHVRVSRIFSAELDVLMEETIHFRHADVSQRPTINPFSTMTSVRHAALNLQKFKIYQNQMLVKIKELSYFLLIQILSFVLEEAVNKKEET